MYSQHDEEKHILEAVKDCSRKQLLDIGAWDPKDKSNSRALIEQGWGGVLIEPSPVPLRNLAIEYYGREDIKVVSAIVAAEHLLSEIEITDDAVSTTEKAHADKWRNTVKFIGRIQVWTMTIPQIADIYGKFEFVNIDAEGTSVDILKSLLATEMFPKCICFEHDGRYVEAMQAARARQYRSVYESEENIILSL